ncbi:MAG: hypothetical protein EOM64_00295 [Erysipelotrichia bacterium]|nr:hypothetical protein [Erysipelotrichia bacterium]
MAETGEKKKSRLSMEISLKKKAIYPEKTSVNFIFNEQKKTNRYAIIGFVLFMLALAVFVKFAVIDPMNKISAMEQRYNLDTAQLQLYQSETADYQATQEKYNSMSGTFMTADEKYFMQRMDMIQMLEDDLINDVPVQNMQITGNTITVNTGNTTLPTVSALLYKMQNDARNSYVTVITTSASGAENDSMVTANFEIVYAGGTE